MALYSRNNPRPPHPLPSDRQLPVPLRRPIFPLLLSRPQTPGEEEVHLHRPLLRRHFGRSGAAVARRSSAGDPADGEGAGPSEQDEGGEERGPLPADRSEAGRVLRNVVHHGVREPRQRQARRLRHRVRRLRHRWCNL
ncbi:iron-sulfur assembly protein IscA [Iris pallida]|uniref:Iron-sulfur assembly protein IscA n=1 Tax=Iris pallida TaxID=29817 RepID=A0AAX6FK05_IRIPA|nr:iron-sulfur assembly protein IscA [Iris pallida]